jgi:16S rRNA (cytosine967-C5)-methyltransferase
VPPEGATADRRVAFAVLRRVAGGAYADRALAGEARRHALTGAERSRAHRLTFGTVQRRRTLDGLLDPLLERPEGVEAAVRDILRIGAYELAFSDGVPPSAAVDQAVRLARSLPGPARRAGFRAGLVNAVLRKLAPIAKEAVAALPDDTPAAAAIAHSVPDWIAERLFAALGPEDARAVLVAGNEPAESALRWNPLQGAREDLERLLPPGTRRDPTIDEAYVLTAPFALEDSQIWREGRALGQSRASMLPARAVDPRPGERILDLCAAPGAKATHLAALSGNGAEIVCVEAQPARAAALRALAERLGARLTVIEGDARDVPLPGGFDGALVDPPCTGLGVLSARPDARWRRAESDIVPLVALQRAILARAICEVRPGGRVVYSTCTLLPDENEDVVADVGLATDDLGARFPAFRHPGCAGALRTLPGRHGTDGFFVARLSVPTS